MREWKAYNTWRQFIAENCPDDRHELYIKNLLDTAIATRDLWRRKRRWTLYYKASRSAAALKLLSDDFQRYGEAIFAI